ncbi:MAG: hypothetical protein VX438_13070, partial [Planctomycetota bacterium]|nr:hypothetical protein [Planctomycetota bacterium]
MNKTFFSAISLTLLGVTCILLGYLLGNHRTVEITSAEVRQSAQPSQELKELILKADSASSGTKIAMATGSIDGNIDVVFTLDYESGNLFAWLPGPNGFLGEW